jgi:hypothetical protein
VILKSGEVVSGDVIIGADGAFNIHSAHEKLVYNFCYRSVVYTALRHSRP